VGSRDNPGLREPRVFREPVELRVPAVSRVIRASQDFPAYPERQARAVRLVLQGSPDILVFQASRVCPGPVD